MREVFEKNRRFLTYLFYFLLNRHTNNMTAIEATDSKAGIFVFCFVGAAVAVGVGITIPGMKGVIVGLTAVLFEATAWELSTTEVFATIFAKEYWEILSKGLVNVSAYSYALTASVGSIPAIRASLIAALADSLLSSTFSLASVVPNNPMEVLAVIVA